MQIVLATHNIHKIREFKTILKEHPSVELLSLADFPDYTPPEETGKTFEENALLKAEAAVNFLKRWVIADDSGLVVPILGGAPGVLSARYAGATSSDLDNRRKLLHEMSNRRERNAYFECVIALVSPQGEQRLFKGLCEGFLATEERGRNGFGYDSIFIKHDYHKTFAELDEVVKNHISHRRKAIDKLINALPH